MYFNEVDVGRAINDKISDGTVTRDEIYLTTKLWCFQWDDAEKALDEALKVWLKYFIVSKKKFWG